MPEEKDRYCSFCGQPSDIVDLLIAAPGEQAFICNECVVSCVDLINKVYIERRNGKQNKRKEVQS